MEATPKPVTTFFTAQKDGKLVVHIHMDGSVEFGEGVEPEEAAKQFYNYVAGYVRAHGLAGTPEADEAS